jgi:hypothetical protein
MIKQGVKAPNGRYPTQTFDEAHNTQPTPDKGVGECYNEQ